MNKENCLLLGAITKANRKTGQLTISTGQQPAEKFADIKTLFLEIDGGLVPFFVEQQSGSGSGQLRVWLQDYKTPEAAQQLTGYQVYIAEADLPVAKSDRLYQHQLTDYSIVDKTAGTLGKVTDLIESTEQVLLLVEHNGGEVLIPFVEDFIVKIDKSKKILYLDLPEGLIELNK
ncbi:MAG: 16S rRNA processing protein RimM [Clostridia bacterium]|nr:16S rRNA processing protein RimM [Clostridia bacterium]